MKTLKIINKLVQENGTLVNYEVLEDDVVIDIGERFVPNGYDRLLIPQVDGVALSVSLW